MTGANPKTSAVAAIAESLGSGEFRGAHAAAAENSDDLFQAFSEEVDALAGHTIAPPRRAAGRPPGAVNRRTEQLQRWLLAKGYRDPAEFLAALASADPRELAARLKGKATLDGVTFDQAIEALKIQKDAAKELMRYFHTPLTPVEANDDHKRTLIVIGRDRVTVAPPGERNQRLTVSFPNVSDGDVSDEQAQVIDGTAEREDLSTD